VDIQDDKLEGGELHIVQDDGPRRQVFIKFNEGETAAELLQKTGTAVSYEHINGICSNVNLHRSEFGLRKIRTFSFPPEMSKEKIRQVLSSYGLIMEVQDEIW
jgi:hypothetical protein